MLGNLDAEQIKTNLQDEWLTTTQAIISDIEQDLARHAYNKTQVEEQIQALETELSYLKAAVTSYKKRYRTAAMSLTEEQRTLLKGKPTAKQARLLAFWCGGDLIMKDAVKLLSQGGFIEGEHPDSALYSAVGRDESFERVKRGVYHFTPPEGWSVHDGEEEQEKKEIEIPDLAPPELIPIEEVEVVEHEEELDQDVTSAFSIEEMVTVNGQFFLPAA